MIPKPFKQQYKIEIGAFDRITIFLVGCGGTGSFAALHLARLAYAAAVPIRLVFIDPDVVEAKNVGRQNFAPAEVGEFKAVTLARRYSLAFGLDIVAVPQRFVPQHVPEFRRVFDDPILVVGCVDNAAARRAISEVLWSGREWWLDAGNGEHFGQVRIGNDTAPQPTIKTGWCTRLPLPHVQDPALLAEPAVAELVKLSCAELLALEAQSLMINQAMAGWLAIYAYRLLLGRDLDLMASYVNLTTGQVASVPITGQEAELEVTEQPAAQRSDLVEWLEAGGAMTDDDVLRIQDGECPACNGQVITGRDMVDGAVENILFCPVCEWQIVQADFEQLVETVVLADEALGLFDG